MQSGHRMIGVIARTEEFSAVEEFFQMFKTPWEHYRPGRSYEVVLATAEDARVMDTRLLIIYGSDLSVRDRHSGVSGELRSKGITVNYQGIPVPLYGCARLFRGAELNPLCYTSGGDIVGFRSQLMPTTVLRLGYDLFQEIRCLLSDGQPAENAHIPTLEIHIAMLRSWILAAGISLIEIPPIPAGKDFTVCLTHDIDFVGIRRHKFDHTMWGFLYRSTFGALREAARGKLSFARLLKIWRAAASLPFVYLGSVRDFWIPFEWYMLVEKDLPATYYLIPFKRRAGDHVRARHAARRATAYDITDIPEWTTALVKAGCEIGAHGIDAWHSTRKGREELHRIRQVTGRKRIGIRMHWLLRDENTSRVLEEAGYAYDSTAGYNETVGYRCGSTQAFRPIGARQLLELPMHIQDGALFYPHRLGLSELGAWAICSSMIANSKKFGGVLTVLWHDRSHGAERYWGDFYVRLVAELRSLNVWFATSAQAVDWFRKRRAIVFNSADSRTGRCHMRLSACRELSGPHLTVRIHHPPDSGAAGRIEDIPWNGDKELTVTASGVMEEATTF